MAINRFRNALLSIMFALIAGCGKSEPAAPPTPSVNVSKPVSQEVTEYNEYSGHLESPQVTNVSARVSGEIVESPFTEGSIVKEGDLLFVIDQRPYLADVASKEAQVAKTKAQLTLTELVLKRYETLKGTKAISQQDYDQSVASLKQAGGELQSAEAALELARLNLGWTRVTATIPGRVGRKLVTTGNLVNGGQGQATLLTTITSVDPIYAYINVPERAFLKCKALSERSDNGDTVSKRSPACAIQLETENVFGHDGSIDFIDNHIDPTTGTIEMRCVVPNPTSVLTPGLFARVRIPGSNPYRTLLVPDRAIGTDQSFRFLLVVGKENKVESRPVKLGTLFGRMRSVTEGISVDDLVIVDGLQAGRPGTKVEPVEVPTEQSVS